MQPCPRAAGHWALVAMDPKTTTVQPKSSFRLAATYKMKARGFHYLLVRDGDFGTGDFQDDPEAGAWQLWLPHQHYDSGSCFAIVALR